MSKKFDQESEQYVFTSKNRPPLGATLQGFAATSIRNRQEEILKKKSIKSYLEFQKQKNLIKPFLYASFYMPVLRK